MTTTTNQPLADARGVFAIIHEEGNARPVFAGITPIVCRSEYWVRKIILATFPNVRKAKLAVVDGGRVPDAFRATGGTFLFSQTEKNKLAKLFRRATRPAGHSTKTAKPKRKAGKKKKK